MGGEIGCEVRGRVVEWREIKTVTRNETTMAEDPTYSPLRVGHTEDSRTG